MDTAKVLSDSFSLWARDPDGRKHFYTILALQLLLAGASIAVTAASLGNDFWALPYLSAAPSEELSTKYLYTQVALLPISVAFGAAIAYVYVLLTLLALHKQGYATIEKPKARKTLQAFLTMVVSSLAAALSAFDLKLLSLPLAAAALTLAAPSLEAFSGAASSYAGALTLVLVALYAAAVARNSVRLSLSLPLFLSREASVWEAVSGSWRITRGKTLGMLVPMATVLALFIAAALTLAYVFGSLGKWLGLYTGIIALASILETIPWVAAGAAYSAWSMCLSAVLLKETEA